MSTSSIKSFRRRRRQHFTMILRLAKEGDVPLLKAEDTDPESIDGWNIEDPDLLIAEGRRRFDEEMATLRDIRSRAQLVFSTALVVLAVLASESSGLALRVPTLSDVVSTIGFFAGGVAALGASSIVVVGAPMGVITLPDLTQTPGDDSLAAEKLARQYLRIAGQNRTVVRTWHTHFFESVVWLLTSSACAVIQFI